MSEHNEVVIEIIPTTFPQHNAKNNLPSDHKVSSLSVKRLKHGHLRSMQRLNEEEQIHFLMSQLTGLSQTDLDELDIEDSAKFSEVIFGFMRRYAQMAKEISRS